jgi:hypothetical protein
LGAQLCLSDKKSLTIYQVVPTLQKIQDIQTGYLASLGDFKVRFVQRQTLGELGSGTEIVATVEQRVSGRDVWTERKAEISHTGNGAVEKSFEHLYMVSTPNVFMLYHVGNPFAYIWDIPASGQLPEEARLQLNGWGASQLTRHAFGDKKSNPAALRELLDGDPAIGADVTGALDPIVDLSAQLPPEPVGDILFTLARANGPRMEVQYNSRCGYLLNSARLYADAVVMTQSMTLEPREVKPECWIPWHWRIENYVPERVAGDQLPRTTGTKDFQVTDIIFTEIAPSDFEFSSLNVPDGLKVIRCDEQARLSTYIVENGALRIDETVSAQVPIEGVPNN